MKIQPIKKNYPSTCRASGIYNTLKQMCYNPEYKSYHNYGGKGIKMAKEWQGPNGRNIFCEWAYNNGLSENLPKGICFISRYDIHKDYSPDNCFFTTNNEISNYKEQTKYVYWFEKQYNKVILERLYKTGSYQLRSRLEDGCKGGEIYDLLSTQASLKRYAFNRVPFKFVDHSEIAVNDVRRTIFEKEHFKHEQALDVIATQKRLRARDLGHPVKPFQITDGKSDDFLCSYVDPLIPYRNQFEKT